MTTTSHSTDKCYALSYSTLAGMMCTDSLTPRYRSKVKRELNIRRMTSPIIEECLYEISYIMNSSTYSSDDKLAFFKHARDREQSKSNRKTVIKKLDRSIHALEKTS